MTPALAALGRGEIPPHPCVSGVPGGLQWPCNSNSLWGCSDARQWARGGGVGGGGGWGEEQCQDVAQRLLYSPQQDLRRCTLTRVLFFFNTRPARQRQAWAMKRRSFQIQTLPQGSNVRCFCVGGAAAVVVVSTSPPAQPPLVTTLM